MNILVIGANSQIGRYLIKYLKESGRHHIKALVHNTAQSAYFDSFGVESFVLHSNESLRPFISWIDPVEAIVFAGSMDMEDGESSVLMEIDLTIRVMEAIKKANGRRIVYLSTIDFRKENWPHFPEYFIPQLVKNHQMVHWVRNSNLDYTIIQTGNLNDGSGNGLVEIVDMDSKKGEISRQDAAKVIRFCIEENAGIGKEFKIIAGKRSILSAMKDSRISSSP